MTYLKSGIFLLAAGIFSITFTACSNEDENQPAPALKSIAMNHVSPLTEEGVLSATFNVEPADARVGKATIDNKGFTVENIESKGNGEWEVTAKVVDFGCIKASQPVTLTVTQPDGIQAETQMTVEDPFAVDGKYQLVFPHSYSVCSIETGKPIGLPLIVTAKNEADLKEISDFKFTNKEGLVVNHFSADWFKLESMKDETGVFLVAKQEAIDQLKEQRVPQQLSIFNLVIICKNSRSQLTPLKDVYASYPEQTLENEDLCITSEELADPTFNKEVSLDAKAVMVRLGLYNRKSNDVKWSEVMQTENGFFNESGQPLEGENFIVPMITQEEDDTFKATVSLFGQENAPFKPGLYFYVTRFSLDWKYNGKTYPRIDADLKCKIAIQ